MRDHIEPAPPVGRSRSSGSSAGMEGFAHPYVVDERFATPRASTARSGRGSFGDVASTSLLSARSGHSVAAGTPPVHLVATDRESGAGGSGMVTTTVSPGPGTPTYGAGGLRHAGAGAPGHAGVAADLSRSGPILERRSSDGSSSAATSHLSLGSGGLPSARSLGSHYDYGVPRTARGRTGSLLPPVPLRVCTSAEHFDHPDAGATSPAAAHLSGVATAAPVAASATPYWTTTSAQRPPRASSGPADWSNRSVPLGVGRRRDPSESLPRPGHSGTPMAAYTAAAAAASSASGAPYRHGSASDRVVGLRPMASKLDDSSGLAFAGADDRPWGGDSVPVYAASYEESGISVEPLFSYARHGRAEELGEALDEGTIHVDVRDLHGNTLLVVAAQNGSKRTIKALLRRGADINARNHQGNTAAHYAFTFGYSELGEYLISKGLDSTLCNATGATCREGLHGVGK